MGTEIERKFLIDPTKVPLAHEPGRLLKQGYLSKNPCVRVRIRYTGPSLAAAAWITVKGSGLITRAEFEYNIPPDDSEQLLQMCQGVVEKTRFGIWHLGNWKWDVDRFEGDLAGNWLAEIELNRPDEPFTMPEWVTKEVTDDPRYQNLAISELGFPSESNRWPEIRKTSESRIFPRETWVLETRRGIVGTFIHEDEAKLERSKLLHSLGVPQALV
jgi:adenylate cyclase